MKIAAVVVTFNRKALLLETLRGLTEQTRKPDHIYVIDNASSDGTGDELEYSGFLSREDVSYVKLDKNTGGAGGFNRGIEIAKQAGYDWFWTMDDDVEPEEKALEVLLEYIEISECINSTKTFTESGEVQYWEQYFDFATGRLIDLKNSSFWNEKKWCPVNVACFEGMLVSKRIVDLVGLPDKSYFIYHDDTVFGIKASLYTNVIYVRDAVFRKKIYGYGKASPFRAYYTIRNSFKLKRDVFATGMVGSSAKFTNLLFCANLFKISFSIIRESTTLATFKSVLKGWWHGYRGV